MRTIVIIGGIVLAGATLIAVMMNQRNDSNVAAPGVENTKGAEAQPAGNGTAKLNPAHGQPGHRCDLAVGAPLDGSPTSTTPPATISPVQQPQQTSPTNLKVNPPHGQPGHRCDLQVGAPLK